MSKLLNSILLYTTIIILFPACSEKEDIEPPQEDVEIETTYTFVYNAHTNKELSVVLFQCNKDGDKIKNNSIKCLKGEQRTFTVDPNAAKIKVYIENNWVQQVYLLHKGGNIVIEITNNTLVGKTEP